MHTHAHVGRRTCTRTHTTKTETEHCIIDPPPGRTTEMARLEQHQGQRERWFLNILVSGIWGQIPTRTKRTMRLGKSPAGFLDLILFLRCNCRFGEEHGDHDGVSRAPRSGCRRWSRLPSIRSPPPPPWPVGGHSTRRDRYEPKMPGEGFSPTSCKLVSG